ncbi:MAG: hypothetical protein B7C24_17120 [Bacteroidetes bacterium 4572_77]|nr:MAG: hypothetical protein B7C24_17120 [Bacteroidetes bacterium 4572_77]
MMKKAGILLLIIFSVMVSNTYGKDSLRVKLGLYGGYNYNIHTADFYKLKNIPNCCKKFENGYGSGYNFGVLFEYKLSDKFALGLRFNAILLDGTLTASDTTRVILNDGPTTGKFEHSMTGEFFSIAGEPTLNYNPFGGLYFSIGGRFGTNIMASFDQKEQLTEPNERGTFADADGNNTHQQTRNEFSGDIPKEELQLFQTQVLARISYELPLNKKASVLIVPELAYYFPLTENVNNTNWKTAPICIGLAIKFVPQPKKPKPKPIEKIEILNLEWDIDTVKIEVENIDRDTIIEGMAMFIDEIIESTETEIIKTEYYKRTDTLKYPAPKYEIDLDISAVGLDKNHRELKNMNVVIEEFIYNRLDPLLNYIFFEENSTIIPERYVLLDSGEVTAFKFDDLFEVNTLDIYYNILNIVGYRMRQYPAAKLTITGCNAGVLTEKDHIAISEHRAKAVLGYLINIWGIDENRLILKIQNLPTQSSAPINHVLTMQENRRVEIESDNKKILEPVYMKRITRTATPPIAKFKLKARADAGIAKWEMLATHGNYDEVRFIKQDSCEMPKEIYWDFAKNQKTIPNENMPVKYYLSVTDSMGNTKQSEIKEIPIKLITIKEKMLQEIDNYKVEKFSLILFGFNTAQISDANRELLDFISKQITEDSEVEIKGYTDITGAGAYNQDLSIRRATSAKEALGLEHATVLGISEEELMYDNQYPEGRFYCRTVVITIKTKMR